MARGDSDVVAMALQVLENAAQQGRKGPVEKSVLIALALGCLISRQATAPVRWPFLMFWKHLGGDNDIGRSQNLQAALNAIYRAVSRTRA